MIHAHGLLLFPLLTQVPGMLRRIFMFFTDRHGRPPARSRKPWVGPPGELGTDSASRNRLHRCSALPGLPLLPMAAARHAVYPPANGARRSPSDGELPLAPECIAGHDSQRVISRESKPGVVDELGPQRNCARNGPAIYPASLRTVTYLRRCPVRTRHCINTETVHPKRKARSQRTPSG